MRAVWDPRVNNLVKETPVGHGTDWGASVGSSPTAERAITEAKCPTTVQGTDAPTGVKTDGAMKEGAGYNC